ncbi:hypothetical protein BH23THE1_BH23THE1_28390 [soil metagenome]
MVNTFLVDKNFRVSASKLDNLRLGKQRVEAYQILIALNQLRFLSRHFNIPDYPVNQDTPKSQREAWIHNVVNTFKQSGYSAIHLRANILIYYQPGQSLPRKPESGNKLLYDSANGVVYEVKGKRERVVASGPWHTFVLPGEELITTGFRKHPAVCMWLGFEEALKDYINAHIETWIARGKNNTMRTYAVSEICARPAWTNSDAIINNFKSTLVDREIRRHEPAWYLKYDDFIDVWAHTVECADRVKYGIKQLPSEDWYNYINDELLMTFGTFPGFIWP